MTRSRLRADIALWRHPLTFLLGAATIYTVAFAIARSLPELPDASLVALGVTSDLVLLIPLLYYLMLVRGRGWPVFSLVPVFLASLVGAGFVLPEEHEGALRAARTLIAPLELAILGFLVFKATRLVKAVRGRQRADVFESLRKSARNMIDQPVVAEVLAFEAAIFYYALIAWRAKPRAPEAATSFTCHEKVAYTTVFAGLIMAAMVEILPVHLLVSHWSPVAAWVLTGLSLYGLVWLLGDYRAIVLRPTLVADGVLHLRIGLRFNATIPLSAIRRIRPLDAGAPEPKCDYLSTALLGQPRRVIELDHPLEVRCVYGWRRSVRAIGVTIDDEAGFDQAVAFSKTATMQGLDGSS